MEEGQVVKLLCQEQQVIEFDSQIINLSNYIARQANPYAIIPVQNLSHATVSFIKNFCEQHQYNAESMKWTFPFNSDHLKDHVDSISYDLFKEYCASGQSKERLIECTKKLAPIIEAAFFLEMNKLKKISNVVMQIPLFCGPSEDEINKFKLKWGIHEDEITQEKQKNIIDENKPIFDAIKQRFQSKLQDLQAKAQEESNKQD